MIIKNKDLSVVNLKDFLGGQGNTRLEHFMDQEMAKGAGKLFCKVTLEPGASIGKHTHTEDFEVYYFLEGNGIINDNGTDVEVGPGDVNYCPDGQFHSIKNTGKSDLVYIAVVLFTKQKEI